MSEHIIHKTVYARRTSLCLTFVGHALKSWILFVKVEGESQDTLFVPSMDRSLGCCRLSVVVSTDTHLHFIIKIQRIKSTKMKSVIFASLVATAAAFAPAKQAASSTGLNAAFEDALGAQPPLGFYDPLGLVTNGDQAKFDRLREVELKHGRISMLAVVGYLVQEAGIRLPGTIDFSGKTFASIPNGFAAFKEIPAGGLVQLLFFIGVLESSVMRDVTGESEFVGDFRNGAIDFGWDTFDEETKLKKRAIELNQGRAAMMGILGLMVHEQLGVSILP